MSETTDEKLDTATQTGGVKRTKTAQAETEFSTGSDLKGLAETMLLNDMIKQRKAGGGRAKQIID